MVTNIKFDLDDPLRRLIARKIDQDKGKHTRGRRLATRAEIGQYIADLFAKDLTTLQTGAGDA